MARGDHAALLDSLDERSRHALASAYYARREAAALIRSEYPRELQAPALAELGDAARVDSPAELFRLRCREACVQAFADTLGAPRTVRHAGEHATVETVRGTTVELHRGADGRYGLVWETAPLSRERSRAAAELDLIRKNAELYRSKRALE